MLVDLEYWVWLKTEFFLEIQDFNQKMQKSLDFGTESKFEWIYSYHINSGRGGVIENHKHENLVSFSANVGGMLVFSGLINNSRTGPDVLVSKKVRIFLFKWVEKLFV